MAYFSQNIVLCRICQKNLNFLTKFAIFVCFLCVLDVFCSKPVTEITTLHAFCRKEGCFLSKCHQKYRNMRDFWHNFRKYCQKFVFFWQNPWFLLILCLKCQIMRNFRHSFRKLWKYDAKTGCFLTKLHQKYRNMRDFWNIFRKLWKYDAQTGCFLDNISSKTSKYACFLAQFSQNMNIC